MLLSIALYLLSTFSPAPSPAGPFTFLFIGDAGVNNSTMQWNARNATGFNRHHQLGAMIYLGDNFYQRGLSGNARRRKAQVESILGPFMPLMASLGASNVHSVPGNHDYTGGVIGDLVGGMGLNQKRAELESGISQWTYHIQGASRATYPIAEGSADSVDFIFLNTAVLLGENDDGKRWKIVFGQLERLLDSSAKSPHIRWRIMCGHHSPYSAGVHGLFGNKLGLPCPPVQLSDFNNLFHEAEDLLPGQANNNSEYRRYVDTLMAVIKRTHARVQLFLGGHDHSLQVLEHPNPDCPDCPGTYIISGAGAKIDLVRLSCPPVLFTHPFVHKDGDEAYGKSAAGISIGRFTGRDMLEIWFLQDSAGNVLTMGGRDTFRINTAGRLVN